MKNLINDIVANLRKYIRKARDAKKEAANRKNILAQWEGNGRPAPPPHCYKISTIREYAARFRLKLFIETGTFMGETTAACRDIFSGLMTIELDQTLYENACRKFEHDRHVSVYQGDSGEIIETVLKNIRQPCLFWLDGHYSEGITAKGELNTPIINELRHILTHSINGHAILIDDARYFTGENDYPGLDALQAMISESSPAYKFYVKDDIIRIHP